MDDASLEELLQATGRTEPPPPRVRPDLADAVRRLQLRRRRTRRAVSGMAATAVLLAATYWAVSRPVGPTQTPQNPVARQSQPSPRPPDLSAEDVQRLRAEIAALALDAEGRQRIVQQITRRQRLREQIARLQRHLDQPDPLEVARIEIEKTAFLLVDHAETQLASAPRSLAAEEYRRVLDHFPHTLASRTARKRLSELFPENGDL